MELAVKLTEMYDNAPEGSRNVAILLFGIKYGSIINERKISKSEIIKNTNSQKGSLCSNGNLSELRKGIKLSEYAYCK